MDLWQFWGGIMWVGMGVAGGDGPASVQPARRFVWLRSGCGVKEAVIGNEAVIQKEAVIGKEAVVGRRLWCEGGCDWEGGCGVKEAVIGKEAVVGRRL